MLNGTEKVPPLITDFKEYHTDTTVRFVVKMSQENLQKSEADGLHKVFKLQNPLTCNSMVSWSYTHVANQANLVLFLIPLFPGFQVLFDHVGTLKKYDSVQDILKDFFELRMNYYILRKDWLLGMLGAESAKLTSQARFILEKIQGTLVIGEPPFLSLEHQFGLGFL